MTLTIQILLIYHKLREEIDARNTHTNVVQQLLQFYDPPTPTNHLFWFNERLKILNSQCSLVSDSPLYYSTEEFKLEKDLDWNASRPHFSYTVYAEKKNI